MAADDTAASVNSAGKQSHCLHILSPRALREGEDADIRAVNDCCWHQARVRCPRGLQHEGPPAGAPIVAEAGPMAWLVHTRQMLCCEPQEFSPTASLQPFSPMTDEGRQCFEARRR